MSGFRDIPLPPGVKGYPTSGAARWSTTIIASASGAEDRNQNWTHPLHRYTLAEAVRDQETYAAAERHWKAMRGPFYGFPFKDPLDFASVDLPAPNFPPTISGTDIQIGTGNGLNAIFQLVKPYSVEGLIDEETYLRKITLPVLATVMVTMNGLDPATPDPDLPGGPYVVSVSRPGGVVTITPPPSNAVVIRAGFLFDVPVRFESDDAFAGVVRNYRVAGFSDISLVELRPC